MLPRRVRRKPGGQCVVREKGKSGIKTVTEVLLILCRNNQSSVRQLPQKEYKAMRVVIQENYENMCKWAAGYIAAKIRNHKEDRPFVLGLPTGSSPIGVYKELVRMNQAGELSFANVVTFNMDEYLGLPREHDQSYWYFMHDNFFDHLVDMKPEIINILNGMTDDPEKECAEY